MVTTFTVTVKVVTKKSSLAVPKVTVNVSVALAVSILEDLDLFIEASTFLQLERN